MKKIIRCMFICILTIAILCCCIRKINVASIIGTDKMKIETCQASFVYNEDNLNQLTAYNKYVFVGKVESYKRTEYFDKKDSRSSVTVYSVKVLENIKGELNTSDEIIVEKIGGLIRGSDTFIMYANDVLPAVGNTYVFVASVTEGELICSAPNTVAQLDSDSNYSESEVYKKYVDACEHPEDIDWDKPDKMSRYDVKFKEK